MGLIERLFSPLLRAPDFLIEDVDRKADTTPEIREVPRALCVDGDF